MLHEFSRAELLLGKEGLKKLAESTVAVFGIGGVGAYAVEALARSGVGHLVLVDYDDVCLTNINRQIHALQATVGEPKVELMKKRVAEINPRAKVTAFREFYLPEKSEQLLSPDYNYVIDAMDTVTAKIDIIKKCLAMGIPIVSCMGAGNKLDASAFEVADIAETSVCPLAKVVRKELRKAGIAKGVRVVYSKEPPLTPVETDSSCRDFCICANPDAIGNCAKRNQIPGSVSFVPPVAGLILAGEVVRDITGLTKKR